VRATSSIAVALLPRRLPIPVAAGA